MTLFLTATPFSQTFVDDWILPTNFKLLIQKIDFDDHNIIEYVTDVCVFLERFDLF